MSNKLEDLGKSMELAGQIEMIKLGALLVDTDYLETAILSIRKQASFEDSAAVLNPRWNPHTSGLLTVQANTLQHLLQFIEGLKRCDELKQEKAKHTDAQDEISKMFI